MPTALTHPLAYPRKSWRMAQSPQNSFLMLDLLRAWYWVDEGLQNGLKSKGWDKLRRSQSLILVNIAFGVGRPSELARNIGMSPQAISSLLAHMQQHGLIDVKEDPQDRRAQIVTFSTSSEPRRGDAQMILDRIEDTLRKRLGAERFDTMCEALRIDWGTSVLTPDLHRVSGD